MASYRQFFLEETDRFEVDFLFQLYVDYAMTTGQEGPFLHQGRWFFGSKHFPVATVPDFASQCRWFQMMIKRYWGANKLLVRVKSTRPFSSSVVCWMVCALLPWDFDRLGRVDQTIKDKFGGVVKRGTSISGFFPCSAICTMGYSTTSGGISWLIHLPKCAARTLASCV